jgi:succinoglycan biosynthesis protein ExoO
MSVTVIVPAHNVASLLERCVASVVHNNACTVDVVIVDDASSDATLEVAQALAGRWANVSVIALPLNSGPGAARNAGLLQATGRYVAFVDADDWCSAGRLDRLFELAEELDADMISDDCFMVLEHGSRILSTVYADYDVRGPFPRWVELEELLRAGWLIHPLIRADFLRRHGLQLNAAVRYGEDLLLYAEMLLCGARWAIIDEPLYHHVLRNGSITRSGTAPHALHRELSSLIDRMAGHRSARELEAAQKRLHRVSYTICKKEIAGAMNRRSVSGVTRQLLNGVRYWRLIPANVLSRLRHLRQVKAARQRLLPAAVAPTHGEGAHARRDA